MSERCFRPGGAQTVARSPSLPPLRAFRPPNPSPSPKQSPRLHRWRWRRPMMSSASTSGGDGRPWRTVLLTLRDESLASPSPTALLEFLRRVLLSQASPSLAASATALSPHEVGSDVAFLDDTAAAVASCPGADDALRGVCHLIYDVMCKTNMEIDSSGWLAMLKFLDTLVKCSIEGACVKDLSSRTAALNTTSEFLRFLSFGFVS